MRRVAVDSLPYLRPPSSFDAIGNLPTVVYGERRITCGQIVEGSDTCGVSGGDSLSTATRCVEHPSPVERRLAASAGRRRQFSEHSRLPVGHIAGILPVHRYRSVVLDLKNQDAVS